MSNIPSNSGNLEMLARTQELEQEVEALKSKLDNTGWVRINVNFGENIVADGTFCLYNSFTGCVYLNSLISCTAPTAQQILSIPGLNAYSTQFIFGISTLTNSYKQMTMSGDTNILNLTGGLSLGEKILVNGIIRMR